MQPEMYTHIRVVSAKYSHYCEDSLPVLVQNVKEIMLSIVILAIQPF